MKVTMEVEYPSSLSLTNAQLIQRAFAEAGLDRAEYTVSFDRFRVNDFGQVDVKIVALKKAAKKVKAQ